MSKILGLITFLLIMLIAFCLPLAWQKLLCLTPVSMEQARYWTLISAHFLHLNVWHLLMNMLGLAIYWLIFKPSNIKIFWQILVLALTIGLLLCINLHYSYVGFSAVLYGLFSLALLENRKWLFFIIVVVWIVAQYFLGAMPYEEQLIGGAVASLAHIYGLVVAVVLYLAISFLGKDKG